MADVTACQANKRTRRKAVTAILVSLIIFLTNLKFVYPTPHSGTGSASSAF